MICFPTPDDGDESGRTRLSRVNPSSSAPLALSVLFTATNDVEAFFFGRLWEEGATRALFDTWVATLDEERKANKGDGARRSRENTSLGHRAALRPLLAPVGSISPPSLRRWVIFSLLMPSRRRTRQSSGSYSLGSRAAILGQIRELPKKKRSRLRLSPSSFQTLSSFFFLFLLSLSLSKTQNPKPNRNSASRVRATYGPLDYAASVLPCVRWLSTYSIKSSLLFDVLAGASVAALVVPQGMSYARLAGLPQEYGLYGAFVPVMVYAALGSSRHLVSW